MIRKTSEDLRPQPAYPKSILRCIEHLFSPWCVQSSMRHWLICCIKCIRYGCSMKIVLPDQNPPDVPRSHSGKEGARRTQPRREWCRPAPVANGPAGPAVRGRAGQTMARSDRIRGTGGFADRHGRSSGPTGAVSSMPTPRIRSSTPALQLPGNGLYNPDPRRAVLHGLRPWSP